MGTISIVKKKINQVYMCISRVVMLKSVRIDITLLFFFLFWWGARDEEVIKSRSRVPGVLNIYNYYWFCDNLAFVHVCFHRGRIIKTIE